MITCCRAQSQLERVRERERERTHKDRLDIERRLTDTGQNDRPGSVVRSGVTYYELTTAPRGFDVRLQWPRISCANCAAERYEAPKSSGPEPESWPFLKGQGRGRNVAVGIFQFGSSG